MRTQTEFKGMKQERSLSPRLSLGRHTSCMGGKPSLTVSRRCRHTPIATWSQVFLGYSSRMSLQSSCAAWDRGVRVRCTIRALECPGRSSNYSGDAAMCLRAIVNSRSSRETGARIASAPCAITCVQASHPAKSVLPFDKCI